MQEGVKRQMCEYYSAEYKHRLPIGNVVDEELFEKLVQAVSTGNIEIICQLLPNLGLDVNRLVETDWTLLSIAAWDGNVEIVKLLLSVPGIDVNKAEPLVNAVRQGHREIVNLLLAAPDIDVNIADEYDFTPLYLAVTRGYVEIVKLLLSIPGVDINKGNPLFAAKHSGYTSIANMLIDARVKRCC